ncbi:hypothetical protein Q428_10900 [Fervidicella metallireducens AeB]|uniref:SH3b domain-containing protein n=1 Tax=Fervidicella metallireducens AeB TaxID=1403537 RepID=A0A017RT73_9CLOT|nr:SH3 domain-containing protein [Fervidicella metallireducens]EYE87872.1 hypothetical protein Q428_10900 [Fervidicella metallireducens AeB]
MKKLISIFVFMIMFMSNVFTANAQSYMSYKIQYVELNNNKVQMNLTVNDAKELYGAQVYLSFNKDLLQVKEIVSGNVIKENDSNVKLIFSKYDNEEGLISYCITKIGEVENTNSAGTLLSVIFERKKFGDYNFKMLDKTMFSTKDGVSIAYKLQEDPVIYYPPVMTVNVTGVRLDKTDIELKVGESIRLNETVVPENASNKSVSWISTNSEVISVSNGNVTALKAGAAKVIVKTNEGGFTAECNVTVKGEMEEIPVESIKILPQTVNLKVGEKIQLREDIKPKNATQKEVSWYSSNVKVAEVDSQGRLTAVGEGKAVITVRTDDNKHSDSITVTVIKKEESKKPETKTTQKQSSIGVVKKGGCEIKTSTNSNSKTLTKLPAGAKVEILGTEKGWVKVKVNGKIGYVSSKSLEETKVIQTNNQVTATTNLNVRSTASTKGKVIGEIKKGQKVNVIKKVGDWYQISYNGKTGYILAKYTKK